ncbi:hypothetical protein [Rhizobium sp. BK602]|uniref:hypothetical protein n=1 Tax=Rhizobium sp. BK602 TaxID=2586986 RepID=UPI0016189B94|nr:hypothetical protein [Rhizobium sp. BK602]MBB3609756.1 hypothetical protein [Rhizobium sp. BK602]
MSMQHAKLPGAASELARKISVGLFVCGVTVAGLYAVARTDSERPLMSSIDAVGGGAIKIANARNNASDLQAAIDASPYVLPTPAARPASPNRSASTQTATGAKKVVAHAKVTVVKTAEASDVTRFDRCMPQCDTRDPMIVGQAEPAPPPVDLQVAARYEPEPVDDHPPVGGVRYILNRAVEAPAYVVRKGRAAIDDVRQLSW